MSVNILISDLRLKTKTVNFDGKMEREYFEARGALANAGTGSTLQTRPSFPGESAIVIRRKGF